MLRNREFVKSFLLGCLLSAAACAAAFLWERRFGLLMAAVCLGFLGLFWLTSWQRYRRLRHLAEDINRVLHGDAQLRLEQYAEGELAILHSEIYKMTVRLRQQRQSLQEDKVYLAESLADISHQLRTPLTSINLLVSFLSDPELPQQRRLQVTRELYGLLSRIDWLITALLKLSRLDAGTVQLQSREISMEALLQKALAPLLVPMELREQTLRTQLSGSFCGDVAWTCEAITNVAKNCMEHTPMGGEISVTASENPLYREIVISDNGSGIAAEDLPHIFERFYKGKNSSDQSFGIGLALARRIVTAQNGTLKAESNPASGAKFTFRFYKGTV